MNRKTPVSPRINFLPFPEKFALGSLPPTKFTILYYFLISSSWVLADTVCKAWNSWPFTNLMKIANPPLPVFSDSLDSSCCQYQLRQKQFCNRWSLKQPNMELKKKGGLLTPLFFMKAFILHTHNSTAGLRCSKIPLRIITAKIKLHQCWCAVSRRCQRRFLIWIRNYLRHDSIRTIGQLINAP